jgi:fatty-acyl-CoA synthase
MGVLAGGGSVLLEPRFDAKKVLADMERFAVTHVVGGDDMLAQLMDAWESGMRSSVRRGGIGDHNGRAAEFIAWAQDTWGAAIGGVYGSSEIFALTATWPADLELGLRQRGGGVPVSAAIEVRIADPDSDAPLAVAVTGEIQVRGYNVLDAYLGRPGLLEAAFTGDGWFRSGDLGRLEPDGVGFVYVGRDSDALRLRGFLVEPKEIADFLADQPDVLAAQVVGAPGPTDSAVAVAFVRLAATGSVTVDDLIAACRKELAPYKVPALIEIVESFPLVEGANGAKVKTAELRTQARALLAER